MAMSNRLLLLILITLSLPSAAQQVLRIGYAKQDGTSYAEMANGLLDRVVRSTGARVVVQLVPGGAGSAELDAVRDGKLDGAMVLNEAIGDRAPMLNVAALPGLVRDAGHFRRALDAGLRTGMQRDVGKLGAELLAVGLIDAPVVVAARPIRRVEDFRGIRIAGVPPEQSSWLQRLGAQIVKALPSTPPGAASGTRFAVHEGVVDAIVVPVSAADRVIGARFANAWTIGGMQTWSLVVRPASWQAIDADLRQRIAGDLMKSEREAIVKHEDNLDRGLIRLAAGGIVAERVAPVEQRRALADALTDQIYRDWSATATRRGYDAEATVRDIRAAR